MNIVTKILSWKDYPYMSFSCFDKNNKLNNLDSHYFKYHVESYDYGVVNQHLIMLHTILLKRRFVVL